MSDFYYIVQVEKKFKELSFIVGYIVSTSLYKIDHDQYSDFIDKLISDDINNPDLKVITQELFEILSIISKRLINQYEKNFVKNYFLQVYEICEIQEKKYSQDKNFKKVTDDFIKQLKKD